ncbi:MAG: RNA 2',3'-cyclic phosphodiesterase [Caldilineaceae bacterium]|nr:RNA 2',3'-cyclic phosphodiesterase [Caldilineaceae bacterium]
MRTFIAVEPPQDLRNRVSAAVGKLAALLAEQNAASALHWSPAGNYHLTLRFLGDTSAGQRQQIDALLKTTTAACPPFSLALNGLGAFPNWRKMRVLWVGIGGHVAALAGVQTAVEMGVRECGFAQERQGFHPHLTVARTSRDAPNRLITQAAALLAAHTKLAQELGQWEVSELVLMRSDVRPGGTVYTVLGRFPLAG